jgi:hypothetical protein
VIKIAHLRGSASLGVKLSPLPQPKSFAKLTPVDLFNDRRSSAIRKNAAGIDWRLIRQK